MKSSSNSVVERGVCHVVPGDDGAALALAVRWGLPLAQPDLDPGLRLFVDEEGVRLGDTRPNSPGPILVDFLEPALLRRLKQAGAAKEALARAVGARRGVRPRVVDATAGLGQDAAVLAALGCPMVMVERSPVLCAMLEDGLRRAAEDSRTASMAERISLVHADSVTYLSGLEVDERPEVVYLDPMYAPRPGGARSKRSMQHLQALLGHGEDPPGLLEAALAAACRRVVVKRARLAGALPGPAPDVVFQGKSTRFDVHLRRG